MQCPACGNTSLRPVKLTSSLSARECRKCRGVLIDLLAYRAWAENNPHHEVPVEIESVVEDSSKALICPKCSKLMLKYRISGEHRNRVDVCANCDEAWLDQGEWELLGSLALQSNLAAIFTEPWQRRIRDEDIAASRQQRFKDLLGPQDYAKLMKIKEWIDAHPKKRDIERILNER